MTWIIWAGTLSILMCGALIAHIAEIPGAAYWLGQCAGAVGAGLVVYWLVKFTSAMPVGDEDGNAD